MLGLRDYVRKNGFRSVIIGAVRRHRLRGGRRDRGRRARRRARSYGVSMPSRPLVRSTPATTPPTWPGAPGCTTASEPIQPMVDAFLANLALSGLAVENLQARVRGVILMALSNQDGHLVLTTGNKSELAVGYSTLYGDSVGGFNPIKDVPKTLVWRLATVAQRRRRAPRARRRRSRRTPSPSRPAPSCARASSTPTRCPTTTSSTRSWPTTSTATSAATALLAAGHDPALVDRVLRMVDLAEYKRRQSAPGPKISIKAFGRDRRLPITNRFKG